MNIIVKENTNKNKTNYFEDNLRKVITFKDIKYILNLSNGESKPFVYTHVRASELFYVDYEKYAFGMEEHLQLAKRYNDMKIKRDIPFYFGDRSIYIENHGIFSL